MGGLVQRGGAHRRLKDDTYLLISVGDTLQVIHFQRDTVQPQTIIQQNVVSGTVAVDGWAVVFGTKKTLFFTKTHIDLHDTYTKTCEVVSNIYFYRANL